MRKDNTYNGHKNWNHWNVSLWLFNDEGLYRSMVSYVERSKTLNDAACHILFHVKRISNDENVKTPDGAPYTFTSIRAALCGWEN